MLCHSTVQRSLSRADVRITATAIELIHHHFRLTLTCATVIRTLICRVSRQNRSDVPTSSGDSGINFSALKNAFNSPVRFVVDIRELEIERLLVRVIVTVAFVSSVLFGECRRNKLLLVPAFDQTVC